MRRTSMKWAAVVLAAGAAVSACGTVQMGAAALTVSQRISSATLSNEVANLTAAYQADQHKGVKPQRPTSQEPQQVLTWLLLFQVYDKIAQQHRISVTPAQVQDQLNGLGAQAKQSGLTTAQYASAAGAVPPDLLPELAGTSPSSGRCRPGWTAGRRRRAPPGSRRCKPRWSTLSAWRPRASTST